MTSEIKDYSPKDFLAKQGTDVEALESRFEASMLAFMKSLDKLDDKTFYQSSTLDKWTPAEIADHIIRSHEVFLAAIADVLKGKPALIMPKGYLSAEGNPISPEDQIPIPRRARADLKKDLQTSYKGLRDTFNQAVQAGQLELVCMTHAFLGEVSIFEAMQLSCWHLRHHSRQLPLN